MKLMPDIYESNLDPTENLESDQDLLRRNYSFLRHTIKADGEFPGQVIYAYAPSKGKKYIVLYAPQNEREQAIQILVVRKILESLDVTRAVLLAEIWQRTVPEQEVINGQITRPSELPVEERKEAAMAVLFCKGDDDQFMLGDIERDEEGRVTEVVESPPIEQLGASEGRLVKLLG